MALAVLTRLESSARYSTTDLNVSFVRALQTEQL